ncbi:hypothetical protein QR680_000945 [Steinernema hermaphroditum]|uniref:Uncharacterized protein n=1 Tax=Steinernema hermaphroditum TaxID=289476 RepID=A0AA39GWF3_9BILA|nr:hypothetical protein QR680_000945 [Steinernema hermaphroditum]
MDGNSELYAHWTTESLSKKARFDKKLFEISNERNINAIFQADAMHMFKCVEEDYLQQLATSKVSSGRGKTKRRPESLPIHVTVAKPRRGRGRPRKRPVSQPARVAAAKSGRGRGRPRKCPEGEPTCKTGPVKPLEQLMKGWSEESLEMWKHFDSASNKMASERARSAKWLNDLRVVFCRTTNAFRKEKGNIPEAADGPHVPEVVDGEGRKKTLERRHRSPSVVIIESEEV